jgi:hypothetical protein
MRLILVLVLISGSACFDRIILDGTLKSTRDAAGAFDTLSDAEVARIGAASSLVQLEGMQRLAPDNEDALYLLTQSWAGYAGAFIEDEWEQAIDKEDDDAEAFQSARARDAYDRSIRFGTLLLEQKRPGFVASMKNSDTIKAYLSGFTTTADAEALLWLGAAWLSRGSVASEDSAVVAELFVGVALLERAVALDEDVGYATGLAALGAYHARSPDAELAESKRLFERALTLTHRGALTVQLLYAQSWACHSHDKTAYGKLLAEVIEAPDVLPAQRLENVVAKRKAKRYLTPPRLKRCSF